MLAIDAIGVPNPPTSTPTSRLCQSPVNPERRVAAGTLLITWLIPRDANIGSHDMSPSSAELTASMWAMLPVKTNRQTNVSRSP